VFQKRTVIAYMLTT